MVLDQANGTSKTDGSGYGQKKKHPCLLLRHEKTNLGNIALTTTKPLIRLRRNIPCLKIFSLALDEMHEVVQRAGGWLGRVGQPRFLEGDDKGRRKKFVSENQLSCRLQKKLNRSVKAL